MTNFTKIGLSLVGALIIGTPLIYNNQVNKIVKTQQNLLNRNGVAFIETNKKNLYFKTEIDYNLKIYDSSFLIKNLYPSISDDVLEELKKILNNIEFDIKLSILNYPIYHRDAITIKLSKLSSDVTHELKKTEIGKQFLYFIQNGGLITVLDIDTMKIVKIKQKNIDLSLKNKNDFIKIKLKDLTASLIGKFDLKFNNFSVFTKINSYNIDNFSYTIDRQNLLNNNSILNISNLSLKNNSSIINFKNIEINSFFKTILNTSAISSNLKTELFKFKMGNNYFKTQNVVFHTIISKLDANILKKIIDIRNDNSYFAKNTMKLSNKLLNNGFVIALDPFSLGNTKIKTNNQLYKIEPFRVKIRSNIMQNDYNFQNNPNYFLKFLKTDVMVETTQKNIDLISKFNPMIPTIVKNIAQYKNNKIYLKFEYHNGKITSNGNSLL